MADHLLRRDTNEKIIVRELHNFPMQNLNDESLRRALMQMEAQGLAKGRLKNLYHAYMALQKGETLSGEQLKHAVDTYAKNMHMENHPRIVVEHHKDGRQHFHIVFNILNPDTGLQAKLKFSRMVEWKTSRQLEKELGLKPVECRGRQSRQWEHQRGKRTGIDPHKMRQGITGIYQTSKTGKEFVRNLAHAGYTLTKGRNGRYVLVDKAGDIHGLMRRIEGAKLKDLRHKFPDLKDVPLPSLGNILKECRPRKAPAPRKKIGKAFRKVSSATTKGGRRYTLYIGASGGHLIRPAYKPPMFRSYAAFSGAVKTTGCLTTYRKQHTAPIHPALHNKGGWPEAAILDWKQWGHKAPRRFFTKWPELSI